MTDEDLGSIVKSYIQRSTGTDSDSVSEERRENLDFYYAKKFGNEVDGRSEVISMDVQDTIESMMPDFLEIFAGGDEVVRIEPHGEEDEERAQQETDYLNYIWNHDNSGYELSHDWCWDALVSKNGVAKIWWDDSDFEERLTYTDVTATRAAELMDDEEVEIIEQREKPVPVEMLPIAPEGVMFDLTVLHKRKRGRVKVMIVPPEEFIIAERSVDLEETPFSAHRLTATATELVEMGFDADVVDRLPAYNAQDLTEERNSRYNNENDWLSRETGHDRTTREIEVFECYVKADFNNDGLAEMRQVYVAGGSYEVLSNEEVDDNPFVSMSPLRIPHKFIGRAVADLVKDIQLIKSTLWRQALDNIYNQNNARAALSNKVDLDDWLENRIGGAVRVDTDVGDVGAHIAQITTAPIAQFTMPLMEYADTAREVRTGETRYSQGMDANALNDTATGINLILGRAQKRKLKIARNFAECGFKHAFLKIRKLIIQHQDEPRTVRLRNKWVEVDPRTWRSEMDATVSVGLGHGTKEQQIGMAQLLLNVQKQIIEFQGGTNGPLVRLPNLHKSLADLVEAVGRKSVDAYFMDPDGQEQAPQEPKPDPKLIEVQGKLQIEGQRLELEGHKLQLEGQKLQSDQQGKGADLKMKEQEVVARDALEREKIMLQDERERMKIMLEDERERMRLQIDARKNTLDDDRGRIEMNLDHQNAVDKTALEADKSAFDLALRMGAEHRAEQELDR